VELVEMVRVSTEKQEAARQHDALDSNCVRVFEEKVSGKLAVDQRPGLREALDYMLENDMFAVKEVDRFGRSLMERVFVRTDMFERSVGVKVMEGIAAGEHTERSLVFDLALALAEDRRRDISRKTKNGLEAAWKRGKVCGRSHIADEDKRRIIITRHEEDEESVREIARATALSVGTVHGVLSEHKATIASQNS